MGYKVMGIRFLIKTLLFIFIAIGTIGGCGDSGIVGEFAGEVNCMDGIDNDGDTETDCEDIDCILDPACNVTCDDFLEAFCNRAVDCDGFTFVECIIVVELLIEEIEIFECNDIVELPTANECIADLANFDCAAFNDALGPDSCSPSEGLCDVCDVDEDCADGLFCFDCVGNCTGVASRCTSAFFNQECEDGTFGSLP